LFLARNEAPDEYIPPNFRKDYEEMEKLKERERKRKLALEKTKIRLVNSLL